MLLCLRLALLCECPGVPGVVIQVVEGVSSKILSAVEILMTRILNFGGNAQSCLHPSISKSAKAREEMK